jgi:hypothetical protein
MRPCLVGGGTSKKKCHRRPWAITAIVRSQVLPRWYADANFMSVVGETRVLPEALEDTARRIRQELAGLKG